MSEATESRPIPVGIFVSVTDSPRKRRVKLVRVPRAHRPAPRRIPWRGVTLASVGAWMAILGVVACCAGRPEQQVAQAAPPVVAPTPVVAPPPAVIAAAPVVTPMLVAAIDVPAALAEPEPPEVAPEVPLPAVNVTIPEAVIEVAIANVPDLPPPPAPPVAPAPVKAPVCAANLGTPITFVADPLEAFQRAKKEKKLVFMIHLSGNFEEKEFT